MFRFSIDQSSAERANEKQLASHNVGPDEDWAEGLRDTEGIRESEAYFRAETQTPKSIEEAVRFVQGLFFTTPERVWIGDDVYEVDQETVERAQRTTI